MAAWVCPYLTQSWIKTTQQFLECSNVNFNFYYIIKTQSC